MEKTCTRCYKTKHEGEFYNKASHCKECDKARKRKEHLEKNPEARATGPRNTTEIYYLDGVAMRQCNTCQIHKALEDFVRQKQTKSGYGSRCKKCTQVRKNESNVRIRESNPEDWLERRREYVKTYKKRHPDRVRAQERRRNLRDCYGITIEQYDALLEEQQGKCAGCQAEPKNKRFAVDHDHSCCPGKKTCGECLRGLLCSNCNTALGLLKEDEETMKRLIRYIGNDC